jgi:hypothetical protein
MKVHALATAEIVDTAPGSPGKSFQGPWLPVKLESFKAPEIAHSGTSTPPHRIIPLDEKQDRNGELQDVVFLGGILSFYGKIPDGSIVLDRARIKGMNIDTWA